MIARVEAVRYRCLRSVSQPLDRFRLLVGPNGSGKSTFLDALRLVSDVLKPREKGVEEAIGDRCRDLRELLWRQEGSEFQLAVELRSPPELTPWAEAPLFRYELAIGGVDEKPSIAAEALYFYPSGESTGMLDRSERTLFPDLWPDPESMLQADSRKGRAGRMKVVSKTRDSGKDFFQWRPPDKTNGRSWNQVTSVGRMRAALTFLPEADDSGEDRYAAAKWVRSELKDGIHWIQLDVAAMRRPSPALARGEFADNGGNLPWVAEDLRERDPRQYGQWLDHLRFYLGDDLSEVRGRAQEWDRARYLHISYRSGLEVPVWLVSDGTLRFIALTLLAYSAPPGGVYLIEEPENGIHPRAMQGVYESLSSMWHSQVLLATHSPALLSLAKLSEVLCFRSDEDGATDIVGGEEHPGLEHWRETMRVADLHAAGIL